VTSVRNSSRYAGYGLSSVGQSPKRFKFRVA
jgi:hypothetical protein